MMKKFLAAALLALTSSCVLAIDVDGTVVPDQQSVNGASLVLNGAGIRAAGSIKVYVASLYVLAKSNEATTLLDVAAPRRVELVMLRDLKSSLLYAGFSEGIKLNADVALLERLKPGIAQLGAIFSRMGEVKAGDRLLLDVAADGSVGLSRNGRSEATLAGPDIGPALLNIWLGKTPVSEELKAALLGKVFVAGNANRVRGSAIFEGYSP